MEPKFKVGDTVKLKIGGPKMVVNEILKSRLIVNQGRGFVDEFNGHYQCKWFNDFIQDTGDFAEEALELT